MKYERVFSKRLQKWVYKPDVTIAGYRLRRAEFDSVKEMREAISALRLQARAARYGLVIAGPSVTLAELLQKCEADASFSRQFVPRCREFVEQHGNKGVTDVRRADLKDYQLKLQEAELSNASINLYMAAVSAMLNSACERFGEMEDWRPPKFPKRMETESRDRVLQPAELSKIFTAWTREKIGREATRSRQLRRDLFDVARLMLLTGARRESLVSTTKVRKLTTADIEWQDQMVRLRSSKVGRTYRIPLSNLALALLRRRAARMGALFGPFVRVAVYNALDRVGREAGVPYGRNAVAGWTLHDLRRTAATVVENSLDPPIPYSAVSALLGHKRKDQTATYTRAQQAALRNAVTVLENFCREIDGFCVDLPEFYRVVESNALAKAS